MEVYYKTSTNNMITIDKANPKKSYMKKTLKWIVEKITLPNIEKQKGLSFVLILFFLTRVLASAPSFFPF